MHENSPFFLSRFKWNHDPSCIEAKKVTIISYVPKDNQAKIRYCMRKPTGDCPIVVAETIEICGSSNGDPNAIKCR